MDNSDALAVGPMLERKYNVDEVSSRGPGSILTEDGDQQLVHDPQELLRRSEARFRNMFAASVTGMAISTPLGRFLEANSAYCRILGYDKSELLSLSFSAITHPDDLPLNLKLRDEILTGQRESFVMEKRYIRKDGEFIWVNVSVSTTRTTAGEVATLIVNAEDISDRKAAEARLARMSRLHTVLSEVNGAILRMQDRQQLYNTVCRVMVEFGRLQFALIAEFKTGNSAALPLSWFSDGSEGTIQVPRLIPIAVSPLGEGIIDSAIRTGAYRVTNFVNVNEIENTLPVGDAEPLPHAIAAFPFRIDSQVIGILTLGACEAGYFQSEEIELMVTAAENLAFAIEVSEKDRQRQLAEEKSNRLAAIVESSVDAIFSEDLNGIITSWNKGASDLFGYAASEIIGTSVQRLIPSDRCGEENYIISVAARGQFLQNYETLRQTKSGCLIDISLTASPIKNATGEIVGLSKVARDITQTKRSAARFRRLVDSSAQGVFFWNAMGGIFDANEAFLSLIGYTRDELDRGQIDWSALTPPEYSKLDLRGLRECLDNGFCKPYEKEYIRKDGLRVPILIGAASFDDNRAEGVSFVLDLTERKRLEYQFRQAQKMEAIGNLAGGVAHDFNNILAVIQIQADFLRSSTELAKEQAESIDEIIAAVDRAAAVTRQLLAFGSRDSYQPQDIDLTESISDTLKMLKRLVGENIEMKLKMASDRIFLHADPGMIDQVLLNLVVNARDAMPNGGVLTIETAGIELDEFAISQFPQARAGSFVCLTVSDNGVGISNENISRIFEPFFTTKEIGKGSGLGLATVFGIVQQHQGWVSVYSEVGRGTTLRVYLPRLTGDAAPRSLKTDLSDKYAGTETILLVEDDPNLRGSVCRALANLGYTVLEAQSASAALDIWRENCNAIELLLTDLVMPGEMTGGKLGQLLINENPQLKVVYMSGYSAEVAGRESIIRGGLNFLTKPFSEKRLAEMVRMCLDAT